jgi:hypothetical protein
VLYYLGFRKRLAAEIRLTLPSFHTARGRPLSLCRSTTSLTASLRAFKAFACNVFFVILVLPRYSHNLPI